LGGDYLLVGGTGGANSLYGGASNNTLDGGNNGFVTNYLYGGTGPNIFYQHRSGMLGRFDRDQIFNFHPGDIIWTGMVINPGFTPPAPDRCASRPRSWPARSARSSRSARPQGPGQDQLAPGLHARPVPGEVEQQGVPVGVQPAQRAEQAQHLPAGDRRDEVPSDPGRGVHRRAIRPGR
jgi:hypothetical protein